MKLIIEINENVYEEIMNLHLTKDPYVILNPDIARSVKNGIKYEDIPVFGDWIDVEKSLPALHEKVLVCYKTEDGYSIVISEMNKHGFLIGGEATGWMPLPSHYEKNYSINSEVLNKLNKAFPHAYVNVHGEYIIDDDTNTYFIIKDCKTENDVKAKVLEWLSRPAFKSEYFRTDKENKGFRKKILNGINAFCETNFSKKDIEKIYICLGNRVNHEKTMEFIESNYDMSILK